MQNKSAIWAFAVLLTLACVYTLSFTYVVKGVEEDVEVYAQGKLDSVMNTTDLTGVEQDSVLEYFQTQRLVSIANKPVYPVFDHTFQYCKEREINLGLDLQGGMNVTLEVSVPDVLMALSGYSKDPVFTKAIADARELQKNATEDFVTLFARVYPTGSNMADVFHTRENKNLFPSDATNEAIIAIVRAEAESAISNTEQVIRKRIDNLGVVQPKVQRLGDTGRILVELPGVKDKKRVRKLLQGTAKLEFWPLFDNVQNNDLPGAYTWVDQLNKKLGEAGVGDTITTGEENTEEAIAEAGTDSLTVEADLAKTGDLDALLAGDTTLAGADTAAATAAQSAGEFAKKNPLFAVLRPNIVQDQQSQNYYPGKGPLMGYCSVADTARVMAYLKSAEAAMIFPARTKFLWDSKVEGGIIRLYAARVEDRDGRAPLDGGAIKDARAEVDPLGQPEVSMLMNGEGAKVWQELTKANVNKSIAIVLDNYVYSAPNIISEISGGRSSISGRFTVRETADLANVLKAGKLPAPARIIEEAVVGPSLGKEAVKAGTMSFGLALVVILIYMIFYYSGAGAAADVALLANLFFVLGVLASIGATLTLPGIAGIVLTIGMSVDANVLIYERIREELRNGKGVKLAITDGYSNAYSSIIDANITTLLTGIVLYLFGSGPIKGFATTLIIGILTSLFSAIFITRLIFEYQMEKNKDIKFATSMTKDMFTKMGMKFITNRKKFYIVSGLIILVGIGSMVTKGFNYGVDFTGGRTYLVRFEQPAEPVAIADALGAVFVEEGVTLVPEVKTFGSSNQVKITTKYMIDATGADAEDTVEGVLKEGLNPAWADKYEIMSSQKVGPTIADDIKTSAITAIIFSLIIIFLYIVFRFRKWQFGIGALIAMVHDVLIVLSLFSILYGILPFSLEIDSAFIAAILTVVGYSINDTVVVFDRIREYMGIKKGNIKEITNDALNSTLSRTFNTSLSTFFVLLLIFIFGGEVIRGFVFALMIGVVVGTYSSLCVAAPAVVDLDKSEEA